MPQATREDLAWARSGTKPIYAVRWTLNRARIVRTKKRGREITQVWKRWYERKGWTLRGSIGRYVAYGPEGQEHACVFIVYDPKTLERIE